MILCIWYTRSSCADAAAAGCQEFERMVFAPAATKQAFWLQTSRGLYRRQALLRSFPELWQPVGWTNHMPRAPCAWQGKLSEAAPPWNFVACKVAVEQVCNGHAARFRVEVLTCFAGRFVQSCEMLT